MKSIADQLPREIARQIHSDRRKNEVGYWLTIADGTVLASGGSPVAVFHAAEASGWHPFFICVGREEPRRIRRVTFPYDDGYHGEALPLISVKFRIGSGLAGVVLDRVIPHTAPECRGRQQRQVPWRF